MLNYSSRYLLHADTAGTFQPQEGESFYSSAVTFVKVLKQWGLGLILPSTSSLLICFPYLLHLLGMKNLVTTTILCINKLKFK
jgi:hypothetical protein